MAQAETDLISLLECHDKVILKGRLDKLLQGASKVLDAQVTIERNNLKLELALFSCEFQSDVRFCVLMIPYYPQRQPTAKDVLTASKPSLAIDRLVHKDCNNDSFEETSENDSEGSKETMSVPYHPLLHGICPKSQTTSWLPAASDSQSPSLQGSALPAFANTISGMSITSIADYYRALQSSTPVLLAVPTSQTQSDSSSLRRLNLPTSNNLNLSSTLYSSEIKPSVSWPSLAISTLTNTSSPRVQLPGNVGQAADNSYQNSAKSNGNLLTSWSGLNGAMMDFSKTDAAPSLTSLLQQLELQKKLQSQQQQLSALSLQISNLTALIHQRKTETKPEVRPQESAAGVLASMGESSQDAQANSGEQVDLEDDGRALVGRASQRNVTIRWTREEHVCTNGSAAS